MSAMDDVRQMAAKTGWHVHEEDKAYQVVEFRQGRHYIRVRHDIRGRIISATADNRWLPDTGTRYEVLKKMIDVEGKVKL